MNETNDSCHPFIGPSRLEWPSSSSTPRRRRRRRSFSLIRIVIEFYVHLHSVMHPAPFCPPLGVSSPCSRWTFFGYHPLPSFLPSFLFSGGYFRFRCFLNLRSNFFHLLEMSPRFFENLRPSPLFGFTRLVLVHLNIISHFQVNSASPDFIQSNQFHQFQNRISAKLNWNSPKLKMNFVEKTLKTTLQS